VSLTPEAVQGQTFKEKFKGYAVDEVDAFLERVMHALDDLIAERDQLQRQLTERSDEEPSELLARTLVTAQRAADETVAAAQAEADRLLEEAGSQSAQMLDEAQQRIESERRSLDAESTRVARAAESLVSFRSAYRSRVQAVIAEQLALLDRAGELPDVPQEVRDLATFGESRSGAEGELANGVHDSEPAPVSALESMAGMYGDESLLDPSERLAEAVGDDGRSGNP
jgi:DivIVA domain-containing protein